MPDGGSWRATRTVLPLQLHVHLHMQLSAGPARMAATRHPVSVISQAARPAGGAGGGAGGSSGLYSNATRAPPAKGRSISNRLLGVHPVSTRDRTCRGCNRVLVLGTVGPVSNTQFSHDYPIEAKGAGAAGCLGVDLSSPARIEDSSHSGAAQEPFPPVN